MPPLHFENSVTSGQQVLLEGNNGASSKIKPLEPKKKKYPFMTHSQTLPGEQRTPKKNKIAPKPP